MKCRRLPMVCFSFSDINRYQWEFFTFWQKNCAIESYCVQSPRLFWARIMLKWANKYLGIQRLQSWSVYGDSNSFSMVVSGKKMNCQKVAPFLWNQPTLQKRTHQFWDSKVSGAFPCGLCAKVLCQNVFHNHQAGHPEISIKIIQICSEWETKYPKLLWKFTAHKWSDSALHY